MNPVRFKYFDKIFFSLSLNMTSLFFNIIIIIISFINHRSISNFINISTNSAIAFL